MNVNSQSGHAQAVIERCFFVGKQPHGYLSFGQTFDAIVVRENVFSADAPMGLGIGASQHLGFVDISNNTILTERPLGFFDWGPWENVRIARNLHTHNGLLGMKPSVRLTPNVRGNWTVDHNAFPRQLERGELGLSLEEILPTTPTDHVGQIEFLSTDTSASDYLRLPANSPLATLNTANGLPAYVGALPPGPAPKEGDWFTKLRERWEQLKLAETK